MTAPHIGIIGGVGAIASARFHLDLVEEWARVNCAKTDDAFPFIKHISHHLCLTDRGVVDRGATEAAVATLLTEHFHNFPGHVVAVCNSISQFVPKTPQFITPVFSCKHALAGVSRAWLLASESTISDRIYQETYPHVEWNALAVTAQIQEIISGGGESIYQLGITSDLPIVLGCTELSTMPKQYRLNAISPTDEMIKILCANETHATKQI